MDNIKREFVTKALLPGASMATLCREYGIGRKIGYKWRSQARQEGLNDLPEQSRRPRERPEQLA